MLIKFFTTLIVSILFMGIVFAQNTKQEFNFSGNWVSKKKNPKRQLIIKDQDDKIDIAGKVKVKNDFYENKAQLNLNGSGETTFHYKNGKLTSEVSSVSTREKNKITRKYISRSTLVKKGKKKIKIKFEITETYSLSKKGDKIILKIRRIVLSTSDKKMSELFSASKIIFDKDLKFVYKRK